MAIQGDFNYQATENDRVRATDWLGRLPSFTELFSSPVLPIFHQIDHDAGNDKVHETDRRAGSVKTVVPSFTEFSGGGHFPF